MRRFRLSTLLLTIAIAALVCALFVQERRAAMDQVRLQRELDMMRAELALSNAVGARLAEMLNKPGAVTAALQSVVKSYEPVAIEPADEGDPR